MYQDLKGKVAIVTGGSSGIGTEVVERLAREGMKVVINYLSDTEAATEVANKAISAGGEAIIYKGDISDEQHANQIIIAALDTFGRLDLLVNNAGIEIQKPTHKVELADWEKVISVNLTSFFLTSKAAIDYFIENNIKGSIINMSSVHEIIPWPTFASYAASKGGVRMLTKSLALEYAPHGIRINSVGPGAIETPINHEKLQDKEKRAALEKMIPMDRIGQPHEVAAAVAWLASSEAAYITGITLFIDGGMTLYPSFQGGEG